MEHLAARRDIRRDRIGLLGYSQGATVAPLVRVRSPLVSLLVLLAPEAVVGTTGELERTRVAMEAQRPGSRQWYTEAFELRRLSLRPLLDGASAGDIRRRLVASGKFEPDAVDRHVKWLFRPATLVKLRHDAGETLSKVDVPILAFYFGKDEAVPPAVHEGPFRAAAARAGNADVTVKVFAEYDHGVGPPRALDAPSFPAEYPPPPRQLLDVTSDWLAKRWPERG